MGAEDRKRSDKPLFSLSEQLYCNPHDPKRNLERMNKKTSTQVGQVTEQAERLKISSNDDEEVVEVVEEVVVEEGDEGAEGEEVVEVVEEVVVEEGDEGEDEIVEEVIEEVV